MSHFSPKPGFTLAELLIALALLGIIAAFTIPKVLQASAEQEKVAKLREVVATLENAWYDRKLKQLPPDAGALSYQIRDVLNVTRSNQIPYDPGQPLDGLAATHPCAQHAFVETHLLWQFGSLQFPNGVVVVGAGMGASGVVALEHQSLCIDVNGKAGPNMAGQDVFLGYYSACGVGSPPACNTKSFVWGSVSEPMIDAHENPIVAPPFNTPETWVGTYLVQ